jgi:IPT/TIG domain-containing protein
VLASRGARASFVALALTSFGKADTTRLVSVSSSGEPANAGSIGRGVSADGRYVLFFSSATNLVPGDANRFGDVFVRDRLAGTTIRANLSSSGEAANGYSLDADLSADGRYVAFASVASNLVPDDANGVTDVFVRDLATGETERASVASDGSEADRSSGDVSGISSPPLVAISGDGRFVCFWSHATNLAASSLCVPEAIYVHDRQTRATSWLADRTSFDGCERTRLATWSLGVQLSANGEVVLFRTWGEGGGHNLYVDLYACERQTRAVTPIRQDGSVALESCPSITADGRFVALEGYGGGEVVDRLTGESRSVSFDVDGRSVEGWRLTLSPDGAFAACLANVDVRPPNARVVRFDLTTRAANVGRVVLPSWATQRFACSGGAGTIVFSNELSLVPEDVDGGATSVYAFDSLAVPSIEPSTGSAAGGDVVTFTAGWFSNATVPVVRFGGADATVLDVAGARLRVRTPRGASRVDVTVATAWDWTWVAGGYTYVAPELAARYGNVNTGRGDRESVLLVNALAGDPLTREVGVASGAPITLAITTPSSRATARYVVYGWAGLPSAATHTLLPTLEGAMVLPTPFTGGAPQPPAIWNVLGHRRTLGAPTLASRPAPAILLSRPRGARAGARFTLQGLIEDDASPSGLGLSVTNALLVQVEQ